MSAPGAGGSEAFWTDTHCHLQYVSDLAERNKAVERAVSGGVRRMVCVGTDVASSAEAISISGDTWPGEIWATAGVHPHDSTAGTGELRRLVEETVSSEHHRLVAIGECGLDYHYDHSPREAQREAFAAQVALANEHGLALVIHTREAFNDTLAILDREGVPARTVFHCFSGGPTDAKACLETGGYLSFSGIVTFKKADDVRQSAALCPLDRLLVETDSPYLAPVPHRGSANEPAYVALVGEAIAALRGVEQTELAAATSANAAKAFGLATR